MNAHPPAAVNVPNVGGTSAWRDLLRQSASHLAAWTDQAAVSGSAFVALILLGRWSGADQLGAYAAAISILAVLLAAQEALITRPYSIQFDRLPGSPAEHAFSSLVFSSLLSAAGVGILLGAALGLSAFSSPTIPVVLWVLGGAIPFVLLREFARRFAFAHLKMSRALAIDGCVGAIHLALLGWLVCTNKLSAATALAALGGACATGGVGWLYVARRELAFGFGHLRGTISASWQLGRWLLAGQVALQVQSYAAYWLTLILTGTTATGIYAACMSIVSFANPVLFGFFNILTPKAVRALRNRGNRGLRRQVAFDSLLLAGLMGSFCLLVTVAGQTALTLLYPGAEYHGQGATLVVLALAALGGALGVPASVALASAGHARPVAAVMVATAMFSIVLTWILMTHQGLLGAACALLIAETVGSIGRWTVFLVLVPDEPRQR